MAVGTTRDDCDADGRSGGATSDENEPSRIQAEIALKVKILQQQKRTGTEDNVRDGNANPEDWEGDLFVPRLGALSVDRFNETNDWELLVNAVADSLQFYLSGTA